MSEFQQTIALPSRVGTAAGAMELQARTQGVAGALDNARAAVTAGNTFEHQGRTAQQNAQAEMAQALVASTKEGIIQKCGLPHGNLALLGQAFTGR
jgi:gamma-glutamyl:cysteine ligase YbdK (ATP-grasp superfamily)